MKKFPCSSIPMSKNTPDPDKRTNLPLVFSGDLAVCSTMSGRDPPTISFPVIITESGLVELIEANAGGAKKVTAIINAIVARIRFIILLSGSGNGE